MNQCKKANDDFSIESDIAEIIDSSEELQTLGKKILLAEAGFLGRYFKNIL